MKALMGVKVVDRVLGLYPTTLKVYDEGIKHIPLTSKVRLYKKVYSTLNYGKPIRKRSKHN